MRIAVATPTFRTPEAVLKQCVDSVRQKHVLLTRWRNLTAMGRQTLKLLFGANKRLHTA